MKKIKKLETKRVNTNIVGKLDLGCLGIVNPHVIDLYELSETIHYLLDHIYKKHGAFLDFTKDSYFDDEE